MDKETAFAELVRDYENLRAPAASRAKTIYQPEALFWVLLPTTAELVGRIFPQPIVLSLMLFQRLMRVVAGLISDCVHVREMETMTSAMDAMLGL